MRANTTMIQAGAIVAVCAILCVSCGENSPSAPTTPATASPVLTTITVSLSPATISPGQTATATATARDQNGAAMSVGAMAWTTSSAAVATVGTNGIVTGVAPGTSMIAATASGRTGTATVTVNTTFRVGQEFGGGTIFFVDSSGLHGLVVAGQELDIEWCNNPNLCTTIGATSTTDGASNTTRAISILGNSFLYAAKIARDYRGGGFNDWFLPSVEQLRTLYSVLGRVGNFEPGQYWSSTEADINRAWAVNFFPGSGLASTVPKFHIHEVRPIRAF